MSAENRYYRIELNYRGEEYLFEPNGFYEEVIDGQLQFFK